MLILNGGGLQIRRTRAELRAELRAEHPAERS